MSILRPYPGEVFYYWVIRMYSIDLQRKYTFLRNMFNSQRLGLYQIKGFVDYKMYQYLSIEDIINYHSIIPLIQICVFEKEYERLQVNITRENLMKFKLPQYVKICPRCHNEELKKYGESYLHVEHQLIENRVCSRHKMTLLELKDIRTVELGQNFLSIPSNDLEEVYTPSTDFIFEVSVMISRIFNDKVLKQIYLESAQAKYQNRLDELGYYSDTSLIEKDKVKKRKYKTKVYEEREHKKREVQQSYLNRLRKEGYFSELQLDKERLIKNIVEYIGSENLSLLEVDISEKQKWLMNVLYTDKSPRLIYHLILIKFLFKSLQEFVQYQPKVFEPFGKGPWECRNSKCKNTFKKVDIRVEGKSKHIIGRYVCDECGESYKVEK